MTMQPFKPPRRTIHEFHEALHRGELKCVSALELCLNSIDEHEERVKAWVLIDRDGALRQARALDLSLRESREAAPLHGVPVGIKDIVDVAGWPTACGSKLWEGRIASQDAPLVKRLRDAGAILLGKTVTTQYASFDPPVTRNPWNAAHTPGGSSSGSAAAVAYGGCLAALGSQTGGSLTRPATYCGVAACKPTYGQLDASGFLPLAPTMDHPGPIANDVRDLALVLDVLAGPESPLRIGPLVMPPQPPKLGRFVSWFDQAGSPDVQAAFDQALRRLQVAGAAIEETRAPAEFNEVARRHHAIMAVEAAAFHEARHARYPEDYKPKITQLLRDGLATSAPEYVRCLTHRQALIRAMAPLFSHYDAVLAPATSTSAPSHETTGDPLFNSPWSYVGFPVVSFPIGLDPQGLPLGLQLVAAPLGEPRLFQAAYWCERALTGFV